MRFTPGTRLGVFELTTLIGRGGMGEVYRARDTKLDRDVAIKILPEAFAHNAERLARFQREARTLASLNHPNIAIIHGLEQAADVHALVMEVVEGDDLSQRIAQGAIPIDEALPIAKQIAEALEAAHEQGIIHRDLKPANIKVRPDGTVKVLDFGLAKAMEPTGAASVSQSMSPTITTPAMTQAGMILGTAAYMSPEQARGKMVDRRADIWAFGAVLFEMLTGTRAFEGEDIADTLGNVMKVEPNWDRCPASIPPRVVQTLRACLQKNPRQRMDSAQGVRLALEGAFETAAPQTASPATSSSVTATRPRWRTALALAVVAAAAGAVGVVIDRSRRPVVPPPALMRFSLPLSEPLNSAPRGALAISPDGTQMAWAGATGLFLKEAEAADAVVVAAGGVGTGFPNTPFFSPDGRWLAFYQAGQLKKVPVDGGSPVTICDLSGSPFGASWGENDEILLGRPNTILRVNANGGTPEEVISVTADSRRLLANPQMLPGAKWFLYVEAPTDGTYDQARVVARSATTNEQKVLVDGARVGMFVNSGHLVYGRGNTLFAVPLDPSDATIRGTAVQLLDGVATVSNPAMQAAVSASGTILYAPGSAMDRPVTRLAQITRSGARTPLVDVAGVAWFPRYSPDGTRVAYGISSSTDLNGPADLWVLDLARGARTRVTFSANNRFYPIWTRDGKRLTFADGTAPTNRLQWALADGSGGLETLVDVGTRRYPTSWSPDGSTLAFYMGGLTTSGPATQAANRDIWMLRMNGEPRTPAAFIAGPFEERGGIFSPSGRWVAYVSNKSGQNDVFVRPYPGPGGEVTISVGGGQEPVWGPSGRELFYRHAGKLLSVRLAEAAGALNVGSPVPVFDDTFQSDIGGAQGGMANYDIAPDGQRFVVIEEESRSDSAGARLQVILNWSEELKARVPTK